MTYVKAAHKQIFLATVIVLGITALLSGLYLSLVHGNKSPVYTQDIPTQQAIHNVDPQAHVYSLPARLLIPKLSIDASILRVGLTASGTMDTPKTNLDTGWFSAGTRPGNIGSAVLAGHLGLKYKGVFKELHTLIAGDTLTVIDDQGTSASFVVRDIKVYEKDSDTTGIFNSNDGAHLNLITCNGDYDTNQATYDKRLVVFADKI